VTTLGDHFLIRGHSIECPSNFICLEVDINDEKKAIKDNLRELKKAINHLKKQHITNRPLAEREIVFNLAEAAQVLGVSRITMWRCRQGFPPPPLPTFKWALRRWAEKYGLPRKRGPLPKGK